MMKRRFYILILLLNIFHLSHATNVFAKTVSKDINENVSYEDTQATTAKNLLPLKLESTKNRIPALTLVANGGICGALYEICINKFGQIPAGPGVSTCGTCLNICTSQGSWPVMPGC